MPCKLQTITEDRISERQTVKAKAHISAKTHISSFLAGLMVVSANISSKMTPSFPWIRNLGSKQIEGGK